jgi:hypothetical protein
MSDDPTAPASSPGADLEQASLDRHYPSSRRPATLFVNNFYVTGANSFIRIAFGESAQEPTGTQYRVAVALPLEDAKELAKVVGEMVAEIEEENASGKKEAR